MTAASWLLGRTAPPPPLKVPKTRLLLAPCCHDSIDLDPPDTEYMMITVDMGCDPDKYRHPSPYGSMSGPAEGQPTGPYVHTVKVEQPYHVNCLRAGRGLLEGVSYEQISVPGPLGTRRLAKRSDLEGS